MTTRQHTEEGLKLATLLLWSAIVNELLVRSLERRDEPIRLMGRQGRTVQMIIAEANGILRARAERFVALGVNVEGWEIAAWHPEREFAENRRVAFVAVDPRGIAHDLLSLARGEDPPVQDSTALAAIEVRAA
jgi:hypothetical protein